MNYEIDLQVTPGSMPPVLHMSQYDTDRTYSVSLYNGGAAVTLDPDATAKVKGVNGKGVVWEIDATVIPPTGLGSDTTVIEFTLTAASTDQFGKTAATIEIDNDGAILSPLCLLFDIQKAGYTNEQAASSPEFQTAMEEAAEGVLESEAFQEALEAAAEVAVASAATDLEPLVVQIQTYGQTYTHASRIDQPLLLSVIHPFRTNGASTLGQRYGQWGEVVTRTEYLFLTSCHSRRGNKQ